MVNKFFRWYRQNKVIFWRNTLVVLGIILVIAFFNKSLSNVPKDNKNTTKYNLHNPSTVKSTESLVGSQQVSQENLNIGNKLIDEFIELLNNGDYNLAYNLLSNDCKKELYPTVASFKTNYYDKNFSTYKSYTMQNWANNTYKIEYRESLLDTGGIESSKFIRDYITIEKEKNEFKLNISGFVNKTALQKKTTYKNIEIEVVSKSKYMDFEIYNISIDNKSSKDIQMCELESADSVFITDENGINYYAYLNELTKQNITVPRGAKVNINIRFMVQNVNNRIIDKITFKKAILDKDKKTYESITINI